MSTNIAYFTTTAGATAASICGEYTQGGVNHGDTKVSQTFTVIAGTWDIARIYFYAGFDHGEGEEAGNITLELRNTDESGTLLGSWVKDRLSITSAGWKYFDITGISLSNGIVYCVVLSCPAGFYNADTNEYDYVSAAFNSGYTGGVGGQYNEVDGWQTTGTSDLLFIVTGDEAAEVPSKAINPTPINAADDVTLDQTEVTWEDGGGATSYDVYYGDTSGSLELVSSGQVGLSFTVSGITLGSPYAYVTTRYWRIDSVNAAGTTTGDEWSFTTINFDCLRISYVLISGGSGAGPYDVAPGVEGTDWRFTGENNLVTIRKLVAAANNKFWYEEL